jgi:hypothetical protein
MKTKTPSLVPTSPATVVPGGFTLGLDLGDASITSARWMRPKWDYALDWYFSLSSLKGGEGRGEEAKTNSNALPLTPALSPFGRGEGVKAAAKLKAGQRHNPSFLAGRPVGPDCGFASFNMAGLLGPKLLWTKRKPGHTTSSCLPCLNAKFKIMSS